VIFYLSSFLILAHSVTTNASSNSIKDSLNINNQAQIPGYISIVSINNSYMYTSDGSNRITIVKSDNQNINEEIGFISANGKIKNLKARNKKLYILTDNGLSIFDVSNPVKSVLLASHNIEEPVGFDITINRVFVLSSNNLFIIDSVAPFEIYENNKGHKLDGPLDIAVIGNSAYLSIRNGVQVFDVSNPSSQNNLGLYPAMKNALDAHHNSLHYEYNDLTSLAPLLQNPESLREFSTFSIHSSEAEILIDNKFDYFLANEDVALINSSESLSNYLVAEKEIQYGPIKNNDDEFTGRFIQPSNGNKGYFVFSGLEASSELKINKGSELQKVEHTTIKNLPQKYMLNNNYPNPFNPYTTIKYEIPKNEKYELQKVHLAVYDIFGRVVNVLVDQLQSAGYYSAEWEPKNISSGIYFYRISIKNSSDMELFYNTKKMIYLK
jgi:hypothetical protein